jgi:hypothetical protein
LELSRTHVRDSHFPVRRQTRAACWRSGARPSANVLVSAQSVSLASATRGLVEEGKQDRSEPAATGREQQRAPVKSQRRRLLQIRACRSLGGCVTSTACSGPPVRPAEHAGRGSAPRSSRIQETFLTSPVRWRELKGRSPGLSVDFPRGPGDDGRVPRLPDCFRTPPPSSALARPASPAPSSSKTTRPVTS